MINSKVVYLFPGSGICRQHCKNIDEIVNFNPGEVFMIPLDAEMEGAKTTIEPGEKL